MHVTPELRPLSLESCWTVGAAVQEVPISGGILSKRTPYDIVAFSEILSGYSLQRFKVTTRSLGDWFRAPRRYQV